MIGNCFMKLPTTMWLKLFSLYFNYAFGFQSYSLGSIAFSELSGIGNDIIIFSVLSGGISLITTICNTMKQFLNVEVE